ncbi:MAG: aldehyde dehydrogenase family protein [Thermoplasmata archaeon]|nr:aldehyde dehydrogenase family protein [Candidatus Sysuiplasma acidicola]MBX8646044.1 aldehyde dehydrogenase family protein [Candidatus Sysuiplasma acidicola]
MTFVNENTYRRFRSEGREEEFHAQYEKAMENARHSLGSTHPLYIGGKSRQSKDGVFEVLSPQNREMLIGRFQKGSGKDAADAIQAAHEAFSAWRHEDYRKRVSIVNAAAEIAAHRKFDIAAMMTLENGKNRFEAMGDADEGIDFMRYYGELITNNRGYTTEMGRSGPSEDNRSVMKPYGVWGVIAPFNFPFAIACGMTTGAIVTGNTAVLKPSSATPMMSLMLYEIYREAGLPDGVLNYVTGPGSAVGREMARNDLVRGIVFTGSREVGLKLSREFNGGNFKPFISEMGGKNVVIVTEHANMEKAVAGTALAAFGFGGQKCSAASRAIVHRSIKEEFTKRLVEYTKKLSTGDPAERGTFLGPVIDKGAVSKYERAVLDARESGQVLTGGNVLKMDALAKGYFVEPTIVDALPADHRLLSEELFLPILALAEYRSFDEAIEFANSVDYGLTAGIFSDDREELNRFFERVEAGVCYANKATGATTAAMVGSQPFVGWKMSGSTGKGAGGMYYLLQFMREQTNSVFG